MRHIISIIDNACFADRPLKDETAAGRGVPAYHATSQPVAGFDWRERWADLHDACTVLAGMPRTPPSVHPARWSHSGAQWRQQCMPRWRPGTPAKPFQLIR